jgi:transcriptional regulator of heat shock response
MISKSRNAPGAAKASTGASASVPTHAAPNTSKQNVEQRWRYSVHFNRRKSRMNGQEFLTELVNQLKPQIEQKEADKELDKARARLRKAIDRLFANEIAQIEALIAEPNRYSVKGWENLVIEAKWNLSRLRTVVERIEEVRPLIKIEDKEPTRLMSSYRQRSVEY